MSHQLLKGKRGIIFGALDPNSIAWITAERVHEEGGTFVLDPFHRYTFHNGFLPQNIPKPMVPIGLGMF